MVEIQIAYQGKLRTFATHGPSGCTMTSVPYRRIGRLALRFVMPANLAQHSRQVVQKAAEECPVRRSLHPDIEVQLQFDYPD